MHAYTFLGLGIGHERCGVPCQDAVSLCQTPDGVIAALSDGASAAAFGAEGARETVAAIQDILGQPMADVPLGDRVTPESLLHDLRERLFERSRELECSDPAQLSATAMFAAVAGGSLLVGNLGDGALFVMDADGEVLLCAGDVRQPGRKPAFGIDSDALQHLRWRTFDLKADRIALVLMTSDGCSEMLQNRGRGDPTETVRELFRYIRDGQLVSCEDLADALDQMAEVTAEREDDWSVVILNFLREDAYFEPPGGAISMLTQEKCKYFPKTFDAGMEVF